jgi:hypothetical protein
MRVTGRLSLPQRIVVVIAWGLVLGAVSLYLNSLGAVSGFGWYAYTPLTSHAFALPPTGLPGWVHLLIWLGLIVVWALGCLWVLRPAPTEAPPPSAQ